MSAKQNAQSISQSEQKQALQKYYVLGQIAWHVTKVDNLESACNIAVAEAGKRLPYFFEIDVPEQKCVWCGRSSKKAFHVVDQALVTLVLGVKVYANSIEGAKRVFGDLIRGNLGEINYKILYVERI